MASLCVIKSGVGSLEKNMEKILPKYHREFYKWLLIVTFVAFYIW